MDGEDGKNDLDKCEAPLLLSEMIAESTWTAMGWTCETRPSAVLTTLRLCMEEYDMVTKYKSKQYER